MHCIRVIATRPVVVALRELRALAEQLEAGVAAYVVAPASATDHHLATAGSVKLIVEFMELADEVRFDLDR